MNDDFHFDDSQIRTAIFGDFQEVIETPSEIELDDIDEHDEDSDDSTSDILSSFFGQFEDDGEEVDDEVRSGGQKEITTTTSSINKEKQKRIDFLWDDSELFPKVRIQSPTITYRCMKSFFGGFVEEEEMKVSLPLTIDDKTFFYVSLGVVDLETQDIKTFIDYFVLLRALKQKIGMLSVCCRLVQGPILPIHFQDLFIKAFQWLEPSVKSSPPFSTGEFEFESSFTLSVFLAMYRIRSRIIACLEDYKLYLRMKGRKKQLKRREGIKTRIKKELWRGIPLTFIEWLHGDADYWFVQRLLREKKFIMMVGEKGGNLRQKKFDVVEFIKQHKDFEKTEGKVGRKKFHYQTWIRRTISKENSLTKELLSKKQDEDKKKKNRKYSLKITSGVEGEDQKCYFCADLWVLVLRSNFFFSCYNFGGSEKTEYLRSKSLQIQHLRIPEIMCVLQYFFYMYEKQYFEKKMNTCEMSTCFRLLSFSDQYFEKEMKVKLLSMIKDKCQFQMTLHDIEKLVVRFGHSVLGEELRKELISVLRKCCGNDGKLTFMRKRYWEMFAESDRKRALERCFLKMRNLILSQQSQINRLNEEMEKMKGTVEMLVKNSKSKSE